jgi:UDP-N-acetylmuramoylalanine--D-glutamate ligase
MAGASLPPLRIDEDLGASDLAGRHVLVTGLGVSGRSAARALLGLGARVTVVDGRDGDGERAAASEIENAGARVRLGDAETPPPGFPPDLVITSPGWRPDQPLLVAAADSGVPIGSEVDLASTLARSQLRSRPSGYLGEAPWLGVTGTNGKTTTVGMLASILAAAGYRAVAAGNVGLPLVDAVLADPPYDVIVAELSSFQLYWTSRLNLDIGCLLNVADDHLDWHGSFTAYATAKAKILDASAEGLVNDDDPTAAAMLDRSHENDPCPHSFSITRRADFCVEGGALLDFSTGPDSDEPAGAATRDREPFAPDAPQLAVPGLDPASRSLPSHPSGGFELASVADVPLPGPHNLANALAAAAMARLLALDGEHPVRAAAVRAGLRAYRPGGHRGAVVAQVDGVDYVDDSKATNPHAAAASLAAHDRVIWIAGGLLKDADPDELVAAAAARFRGVVLLGVERAVLRASVARHAPDVPLIEAGAGETDVMDGTAVMREAVVAASRLAQPGDVVLLAPAAASMDQFRDYAARGAAFAEAARRIERERS